MAAAEYRIESNQPIMGGLWPARGAQHYCVKDRALAIALAAKCMTEPGTDVRVVHVPTGEIVFTKTAPEAAWTEEA